MIKWWWNDDDETIINAGLMSINNEGSSLIATLTVNDSNVKFQPDSAADWLHDLACSTWRILQQAHNDDHPSWPLYVEMTRMYLDSKYPVKFFSEKFMKPLEVWKVSST